MRLTYFSSSLLYLPTKLLLDINITMEVLHKFIYLWFFLFQLLEVNFDTGPHYRMFVSYNLFRVKHEELTVKIVSRLFVDRLAKLSEIGSHINPSDFYV